MPFAKYAEFFNDLADLCRIDWESLRRRDFKRSADDPGKIERYQAEALVYRHLPVSAIGCIACHGPAQTQFADTAANQHGLDLKIVTRPDWYFRAMIRYTRGNLLEAQAEALVNTVNEAGVMGKGIALMFREAFPDNAAA